MRRPPRPPREAAARCSAPTRRSPSEADRRSMAASASTSPRSASSTKWCRATRRRSSRAMPTARRHLVVLLPVDGPSGEQVGRQRPARALPARRASTRAGGRGRCRCRSPSRAASTRGPRWRRCRSRPSAPGSRPARRTTTRTSARPRRAPPARWRGPGRGCCGSGRSARPRRRRAARRRCVKKSRTCTGFAMPVVSPNATSAQPAAASRSAIPSTLSTGTCPSYGQPNEVEITPSQRSPASRARAVTRSIPLSDSSTDRFTFFRLCVSEADRNRFTSWKRSRSSSALSRPRSFGISTDSATPSGGSIAFRTSRASASWGITSARTKLVTSSRSRPGAGEHVDQPHLVLGGDHLRLVLEAVPWSHLAHLHVLAWGHGFQRYRVPGRAYLPRPHRRRHRRARLRPGPAAREGGRPGRDRLTRRRARRGVGREAARARAGRAGRGARPTRRRPPARRDRAAVRAVPQPVGEPHEPEERAARGADPRGRDGAARRRGVRQGDAAARRARRARRASRHRRWRPTACTW